MNVVLINPPTSFDQVYGNWDLSALDTYCPPLGLLYLASYIREHGHEVHVVDVPALKWSLEDTLDFVLPFKPDVVGLSAMTTNVLNANDIAEGLKSNGLAAPIVIGGPHFTATPVETLERFSAIDYGVVGEGEITLIELIYRLLTNQHYDDVKGISFCKEELYVVYF